MNILMAVNKAYLDKAKTMLFSLRLVSKGEINLYLMNTNLCETDLIEFEEFLLNKCNINFNLIQFDNEIIKNMPTTQQFSIETYYRLFAQYCLPKSLERILWLDADIVILKDISGLYYENFNDKAFIVAPDINCHSKRILEIKQSLNIAQSHTYFNAGVLLFNLKHLREKKDCDKIISTCNILKDKLIYLDQDLLNYLYQDNVVYANANIYNNQILFQPTEYYFDEKNTAILHYVGSKKPWFGKNINKYSKYYWKIQLKRGRYIQTIYAYLIAFVLYPFKRIKRMFQ